MGRDLRHGSESDARSRRVGRQTKGARLQRFRRSRARARHREEHDLDREASSQRHRTGCVGGNVWRSRARAWRRTASPITVRLLHHDVQTEGGRLRTNRSTSSIVDLVLEHVERVAHVFAEAARVLRFDGSLFLCELHPIRQYLGGRAHFVDQASREVVDVPVFRHTVSEFVNGGIDAGFTVERLRRLVRRRSGGCPAQTALGAI